MKRAFPFVFVEACVIGVLAGCSNDTLEPDSRRDATAVQSEVTVTGDTLIAAADALLSTAASITRWRSVREPRVFLSDIETERSITVERLGPQPGWPRSSSPTVMVSVSREQRRMASAAAASPERRRRLRSARATRT